MMWPTVPLKEIAPAQTPNIRFLQDELVWHLTLDQIESHTGNIVNKKSAPASEAGTSTNVFDDGNVLYSKLRPYLNKVLCPTEPGIATTELIPLRPRKDLLDRRYLTYYLRSKHFLGFANVAVAGVKMPRIIMAKLWKHQVPLPPLSEQHRIVEIFDQADALRKKRAETDAKAARILPALFYRMFGDPATNPKGWEQKSFDDTFDDCTAKFPKLQRNAYHQAGKFPVADQGKELIAGYTDDKSLVTPVDQPVILFGDHTRIVKFVDFPFVAGADGSRVFMAKNGFSPAFLAYQMELQSIPNLGYSRHMREVRRLHFIAPPFELQESFTHRVLETRPLLISQASCCSRIDALFKGLLHRAFTGNLTAKRREARKKELLQEMEQQSKALKIDDFQFPIEKDHRSSLVNHQSEIPHD